MAYHTMLSIPTSSQQREVTDDTQHSTYVLHSHYPQDIPTSSGHVSYIQNVDMMHARIWPASPLPDAVQLRLKHIEPQLSDLNRNNSSWSDFNYRDNYSSTSTYSHHGDRFSPPFEQDVPPLTPETFPMGFRPEGGEHLYMLGAQTISMGDVQGFVDSPGEFSMLDTGEPTSYQPYFEEGFTTMQDTGASTESYHDVGDMASAQDHAVSSASQASPQLRQRRQAARAHHTKPQSHRISKRNLRRPPPSPSISEQDVEQSTARCFPCPLTPYGCKSTFGSKNEWKRHLSTQHLRLEYWRCDACPSTQGKKPNDFNRRDLFTQHVRRMHIEAPSSPSRNSRGRTQQRPRDDTVEQEVNDAANRCNIKLRTPPQRSSCVICRMAFSGPNSWDERMEHIGKHFESVKRDGREQAGYATDVASWWKDIDVEQWMIREGILTTSLELCSMSED